MGYKIKAGGAFVAHSLEVGPNGVVFVETALFGGKSKFRFEEIDLILMSASSVLSFQARGKVYSLPVTPEKPAHKLTIEALVRSVARTTKAPGRQE